MPLARLPDAGELIDQTVDGTGVRRQEGESNEVAVRTDDTRAAATMGAPHRHEGREAICAGEPRVVNRADRQALMHLREESARPDVEELERLIAFDQLP